MNQVLSQSEVDALMNDVKRNAEANGQDLPSDRALRTQAIERLITKSLQLQMAQRMGIQISDPQLEQTIANIAANQNTTVDELRRQLRLEGIAYEDYREDIREEIVMGEVRRANVRRRVYITDQERETLIELMEQTARAPGWASATLTKVLHRKRPNLVPMLDSIVRKAYCFGPRSDLWRDQELNVLDNSIAALQEFRTELINHLSEIKEAIQLASDKAPQIVPAIISPVRCLEALVWWRDQTGRKST